MTWNLTRRTFADLSCAVIDSGLDPHVTVILCHGYGATGDDLVGLAESLIRGTGDTAEMIRFVFPAAPLSPPEMSAYGGRAWWPINMAQLLAFSDAKSFSELFDAVPPGIETATQQLVACVIEILSEATRSSGQANSSEMPDPPISPPYVLGGFSQGAMVTMNAAVMGDLPQPRMLVQFSGTLICRNPWARALADGRLRETDVLQTHGRQDEILPFTAAEALHECLRTHHVRTRFIPFDGPHTIPMEGLMELANGLKRIGLTAGQDR